MLEIIVNIAFVLVLFLLAIIDLRHRLIPDKIVYPSGAVILLSTVLVPQAGLPSLLSGLLGGLSLGASFSILALVSDGGIGWGDVKMAGLIGLWLGFPLALLVMPLALIIGGIVAGILLSLHRVSKVRPRDGLAFAPALALGAYIIITVPLAL